MHLSGYLQGVFVKHKSSTEESTETVCFNTSCWAHGCWYHWPLFEALYLKIFISSEGKCLDSYTGKNTIEQVKRLPEDRMSKG